MSLPRDPDLGTPARNSETLVTLSIDGFEVRVPEGTSVMRAAESVGCRIPRLCATDSLEPFGSCRLCLVEIEGRRGFPASCTTPVEAGMRVRIQSERLAELRRGVMELVSFRQGCMNSRPRPGTVGAPYLVIRRPHDVAVTSCSQ